MATDYNPVDSNATTDKTVTKKAITKKTTTKKATTKMTESKSAATKKAAGKTTADQKTARKKPAAKKAVSKKSATKKTTAKKAAAKKSAAKKSPNYSAPALEKGLDILEILSESSTGYTLNEISKVANRSINEIFRMVMTLHRRGWVQVDENDRYSLTLRMFELAHRHMPLRSLVSMALPLMRRLVQQAAQSCHLTVLQEGRVVVLAQVDSPGRWSLSLKVGALVGLSDTASGHVLLAFLNSEERNRMLALHAPVRGEKQLSSTQLSKELESVRQKGYAETPSEQIKGVTNIAYPVFGPNQSVIACLNVPYIERIDMHQSPAVEEVKQIVNNYAKELSELMGYSGYNPLV